LITITGITGPWLAKSNVLIYLHPNYINLLLKKVVIVRYVVHN